MFGARALRNSARRVREGKVGKKAWGAVSGVNDTPKLLASLALFVGSSAAGRLLAFLPEGMDASLLLWMVHAVASFAACRVVFFVARRPTLRLLLRVQPWAEPQPQHSPLGVAVWEVALALMQPGNASTAFLERVLPSLPIPSVQRAVQRQLDALEPVASAKARDAAGRGARELLRAPGDLERDVGRRTQEDGSDWAWACTWMEPLVNRDAHLLARCYYLLDRQTLPEGAQNNQAMRAAVLTMRLLDFMKRVGNTTIPCRGLMSRAHPAPKIVPRCVHAFDTLFATSIEPADGAEATLHRRDFQACSHHIVVLCHGQAVEVPVRDLSGARVSEGQLIKLLTSAEICAKKRASTEKRDSCALDALAWLPWSEWSEAISGLSIHNAVKFEGVNQDPGTCAMEKIWSAALVVALDEALPSWPQAQNLHSNRALGLLLGPSPACRGAGRWRDGAFCLVVQPDGYAGLCCSLPLAEPWAAAQMWEFALSKERYPISAAEAEVEVAKPKCICVRSAGYVTAAALRSQAQTAHSVFSTSAERLTLSVIHVKSVGWRTLTRLKVAPGALLHLAAQVALYRVQGAVAFSNVALDVVPTPLFTGGRSDWACTTTASLVKFVKFFCDGHLVSAVQERTAKRRLLLEACRSLERTRTETSLGKGYYRFLLALRGSSTSKRRRSILDALLPSLQEQAASSSVGLCTWLCEVQSDPKTVPEALSLGGGGGFCMASGQGSCRIGVTPVGDSTLVLHVSCLPCTPVWNDSTTPPSPVQGSDVSATEGEEFVDCAEDADHGAEADQAESESARASYLKKRHAGEASADAVAREMERALQDMVHLLQVH